MLVTTQALRVPFVCTDSTGAAVAPTGTPTATLYKNGTAQGDTVTVTVSGADCLASVTVSGVQGDAFYLKILATISGVITPQFSLPEYLAKLPADASDILATPANKIATDNTGKVTASNSIPSASDNATAAAAAILTTPANKIETDNTGKVTASNSIPSASDNATAAAAAILATPANKIATDNTGKVTASNSIPSASDNATAAAAAILTTPGNKLATNSNGYVTSTNGGSGGGGTQLVVPIVTEAGGRVSSQPLILYIDEAMPLHLVARDSNNNARDLTGLNLEFRMSRPPASVRTLADLRAFDLSVSVHDDWYEIDEVAELTGNADGEVDLDMPEFLTKQSGPVSCSLRDSNSWEVLSRLYVVVQYAA